MSARNANPLKVSLLKHIHKLIDCLVNIRDESGEFLMTLEDGRVIDTKGWNDWEWTHGIGLYGLLKYYEITGDKDALEISLAWFKERFEIGTTKVSLFQILVWLVFSFLQNVNTMSPLLTAAYLHEAKNADFLVHMDSWAEWVMYDMPRTEEGGLQHITYLVVNHQQLWDDTLMMTVLPLAKIGLVLDRPRYVEEAKRQFLLHIKYLQDIQTGLWFHGWTFDGRHHFGKARWGRGNCWITVAIPDFIEMLKLSETDGIRQYLVTSLVAQIDALVKLQDQATGLWHTILDDETSYLESSCTAGFAYGILKALRLRLLPKEERYMDSAKKAIQGVLANITPEGELKLVSFGKGDINAGETTLIPSSSMVDTDQGVAFPSPPSPERTGSTPLASTSADTTSITNAPVQSEPGSEPSSSSSPSRGSWLGSFGRSKGKEKAVGVTANNTSSNSVADTPRPASKPLAAFPSTDEGVNNAEDLSSAIEALGSTQPYAFETIRADIQVPRVELPSLTEDSSRTVRASEGPKHSWFNPFAPYPSRPQNTSAQPPPSQPSSFPVSSSTSPSSLRKTSSSYVGSIDDEVPGPVRTPAHSDDEDGQEAQQEVNHLSSTLAPSGISAAVAQCELPPVDNASQSFQPRERLDSLNSLNPSTSRFSISIPLLGRPKMRLEDAVKRGKEIGDKAVKETPQKDAAVSSITATPSISNPSPPLNPLTMTETTAATLATAEAGRADSATNEVAVTIPSPSQPISQEIANNACPPSSSTSQSVNEYNEPIRTDLSSGPPLDIADAPAQSWWSYMGWSSSQSNVTRMEILDSELRTESHEDPTPNLNITQAQPDPLPERCASAPPVMEPSNGNPEPLEAETNSPSNPQSTSTAQPQTETQAYVKAPSIFSLDVARAAGSWFNPWAWYGYGVAEPSPLDTVGSVAINGGPEESGRVSDDGNGNRGSIDDKANMTEMTESEKIKEAALARDRPSGASSSIASATTQEDNTSTGQIDSPTVGFERESQVTPPSVNPINPIADSASYMASGWASFFSLSRGRGLITKNLGDTVPEIEGLKDEVKRDENGMEIMELTDDEAGSVHVNLQEPERELEKAVTKVPASSALILMRALAGHDLKQQKTIEAPKDEKSRLEQDTINTNSNFPRIPPSPSNSSKYNADALGADSVSSSPTKVSSSRPGRASSVSTTQTSTSSVGTKPAPPLTISDELKASVVAAKKGKRAGASPAGPSSLPKDGFSTPSGTDGPKKEKEKEKPKAVVKSGTNTPAPPPPPPNLVLPAWEDTFHTPPRNWVPEQYLPTTNNATGGLGTTIGKTMRYMSGMLLGADSGYTSGGESSRLGAGASATKRRSRRGSSRRRSISGENAIPGGNGVGSEAELIAREREKLRELLNWGHNLPRAWEVIEKAIETRRKSVLEKKGKAKATTEQEGSHRDVTRGCKNVVIIGIHGWFPGAVMRSMLGEPTGTSTKFVNMMEQALAEFQSTHGLKFDKVTKIPLEGEGTIDRRVEKLYENLMSNRSWVDDIHNADYFESAAARELFEFQNTESDVSKAYVQALRNVLHNEIKMVYVASLNDQVVPIYSGLFTSACHPLILRALYIDGDAYHSSDFLTNLLVLLLRVLNCGLSDSGLLAHLSEATAGSLSGIGHSTAYEELSTFSAHCRVFQRIQRNERLRDSVGSSRFNCRRESDSSFLKRDNTTS
ncbi:glycoside hydrolase family 105 protein [Lentinula edodes]|uniref:Glycoside hydrolase family 105 protein n=1 Tax=Lentinula edodes TaxID=5353 RepID=A0A1Q3DVW4_LENED|nr:glycoside hydrolase family 105 protein [Lentinula edodes]